MQYQTLLDIRYYECEHDNIDGTSLPSDTGRIYRMPKSINALGARIARKLREYGFTAGPYDHIYVNYTVALPEGTIRFSPRVVDSRIRYVDYGLAPGKTNKLADSRKELLVLETTLQVLRFIAGEQAVSLQQINTVAAELEKFGSQLEIVHKTKETSTYLVTVTYQIRPGGEASCAFIEYYDKKHDKSSKGLLLELRDFEDLFAVVGTITVSGGVIVLKPRASYKSAVYGRKHRVPLEVPISSLSAG